MKAHYNVLRKTVTERRTNSMAKSKLVQANEKIAGKVVGTYQKIENTVVGSYKKLEDTVVGGYQKVEDAFAARLTRDGETVEDAKARLQEKKENK